jgi:hypothetical protein
MALTIPSAGILSWPNASDLDAASFTVGSRIRTSQANANIGIVGRADASGSNNGFTLFISAAADKAVFASKTAGGSTTISMGNGAGSVLRDGAWHSIAASINRSTGLPAALYVDGVLDSSTTSFGTFSFNSQAVRFGDLADAFWTNFNGDQADMTWWDAALSADECIAFTKGFSPKLIRPQSLIRHVPAVRDLIEEISATPLTSTGCTPGATHPRLQGRV